MWRTAWTKEVANGSPKTGVEPQHPQNCSNSKIGLIPGPSRIIAAGVLLFIAVFGWPIKCQSLKTNAFTVTIYFNHVLLNLTKFIVRFIKMTDSSA